MTNTEFQGSSGSLAPADVMSEAEQLIKLSLVVQTTPIDKGRPVELALFVSKRRSRLMCPPHNAIKYY